MVTNVINPVDRVFPSHTVPSLTESIGSETRVPEHFAAVQFPRRTPNIKQQVSALVVILLSKLKYLRRSATVGGYRKVFVSTYHILPAGTTGCH
jgi:hypothetical protein